MKKTILSITTVLLLTLLTSCTKTKEENSTNNNETKTEQKAISDQRIELVNELVATCEDRVGQNIRVKGMVSHVCSHSGRRCFLVDSTETKSIKVEAGGEIKSFDQELSGTEIIVTGKLEVQKLSNEYLKEAEAELKIDEKGGEHCTSQLQNIKKMQKWMVENNKDYFPIYFITGESYETLD